LYLQLKAKLPANPAYPATLDTLGDHLRKVRLDRGLSQPDVAKILEVTADTITGWELDHHEPPAKFASRIISFLGYNPFKVDGLYLGKQLYYARLISGKIQREVAEIIDCDTSNLRRIELDQRKPRAETRRRIEEYVGAAFGSI
jgi:transcriptional regulator with XRE-family HTH domain